MADVVGGPGTVARRGRVYEELARLIHGGRGGYVAVVIEERGGTTGLRDIPLERIARLARGFLVLDDGTVIPLHRVVGLREQGGGVKLLRRSGEEEQQDA